MPKPTLFVVQLSIAGKPVEQYGIDRQSGFCNLCESRLCYRSDSDIAKEYWHPFVKTGTAYYKFTKESLENGMVLDMSDNPYQPGFCSGSITENKDEALQELKEIAQKSFCPALLKTSEHLK